MRKIYPDPEAALDGVLFDGMTIMSGGFGLSGNPENLIAALKDGRYAESARRFQQFIQQYPTNDLTPNAYYWLGESYYVTQNYKIALQSFQTLLQRYPESQKAPDALLASSTPVFTDRLPARRTSCSPPTPSSTIATDRATSAASSASSRRGEKSRG